MTAFQRRVAACRVPAAGPARRPQHPDHRPTADLDLAWCGPDGTIRRDRRALPDIPLVEATVSSFARSTLLPGPRGGVAVEDLAPGDVLRVHGDRWARVSWIGARTHAAASRTVLYRVAAGAFGGRGPEQDILLGAHAHVLVETQERRDVVDAPLAFAPLAAFEDGHLVTALMPPGEVTVYGLVCDTQEAVRVAGLTVEIPHPAGGDLSYVLPGDWERLLPQGRSGAGRPRIPRLTLVQAQGLALAGF